MKKRLLLVLIGLIMGTLAIISCRRSDVRTMVVYVPQMSNDREIRIITNAALDEIVGRYRGVKNDYEIDLAKHVVLYHESQRLQSLDAQHHIEACVREVGLEARIVSARLNPPALMPSIRGPLQLWPDRFTAVISVPEMKSVTEANIVVDAIAYASLGKDDPRISVSKESRTVVAQYESLNLSLKNIEAAIACAGFDANNTPAKLGAPDAIPHGWTPVTL